MPTRPAIVDLLAGLPDPTPDAVRALRESTGLSCAELGEVLHLADRFTWSKWERGVHRIPPHTWAVAHLTWGLHPAAAAVARRR